jgi:sugar O-acyltransferase (sialic acid O-acetyltransferase NeuD family)
MHLYAAGEQAKIDRPVALLFASLDELERHAQQRAAAAVSDGHEGRITAPARKLAAELGLNIDAIAGTTSELVTTKHVESFAAAQEGAVTDLPDPLEAPPGVKRLVIVGSGLGATQVLDILGHDDGLQAVAIVDDDRGRFGKLVDGVPVVGGMDRALELFAAGALDAAVISISTSVPARTRLRQRCEQAGLPLTNVIDPSTRITAGVQLGAGNVICAHCHIGVATVLGDNNFISAYNSFDHHNVLGNDISTGPGVMTSGLVEIGDRCRFGTGVFVEPHVQIGEGAQIASGAVIVGSIPPDHAVKTRVVTTTVVPVRRPG